MTQPLDIPSANSDRLSPATAALILGAVALFLALGSWDLSLRRQLAETAEEIERMDAANAGIAEEADAARAAGEGVTQFLQDSGRVLQEGKTPGFTPVFASIATTAGSGIEIESLRVSASPGKKGAWEMEAEGAATGAEPRAIAGDFIQALKAAVAREYAGKATASFARLDVDPSPTALRAAFTLVVTFDPAGRPVAQREQGK